MATLNAEALAALPEAGRVKLRKILRHREARHVFFEMVGDEFEKDHGRRPRGLLELFQYIVENWDKIEPIIIFLITIFGL